MTALIPLTNRPESALVDDEDYERIMEFKWRGIIAPRTIYAMATSGDKMLLHRLVLCPVPSNKDVHHKDNNGLNCQKANLAIVTHKTNLMMQSARPGRKYKGVSFYDARGKFRAQLTVNGKQIYLGLFEIEEEAALAYNEAAERILGEGNFVPNKIGSI